MNRLHFITIIIVLAVRQWIRGISQSCLCSHRLQTSIANPMSFPRRGIVRRYWVDGIWLIKSFVLGLIIQMLLYKLANGGGFLLVRKVLLTVVRLQRGQDGKLRFGCVAGLALCVVQVPVLLIVPVEIHSGWHPFFITSALSILSFRFFALNKIVLVEIILFAPFALQWKKCKYTLSRQRFSREPFLTTRQAPQYTASGTYRLLWQIGLGNKLFTKISQLIFFQNICSAVLPTSTNSFGYPSLYLGMFWKDNKRTVVILIGNCDYLRWKAEKFTQASTLIGQMIMSVIPVCSFDYLRTLFSNLIDGPTNRDKHSFLMNFSVGNLAFFSTDVIQLVFFFSFWHFEFCPKKNHSPLTDTSREIKYIYIGRVTMQ